MSEYKLEDAETVALSDATKILGLDAVGAPCWIDPATIAQGGFKAWLDNHSDIVNYWWPDMYDIGLLAKSGRRCTDFNSSGVGITDVVDSVRVYTAVNLANEILTFNSTMTDQISIEMSEIGVFYYDSAAPLGASGDEMRFMANNGSRNSQGFRVLWQFDDYRVYGYAWFNGSVRSNNTIATNLLMSGWNYFHNTVTYNSGTNMITHTTLLNGSVVTSNSYAATSLDLCDSVSSTSSPVLTYSLPNMYPAFYTKSRVPLTEVEADDIFNRFKAGYGIA